VTEHFRDAFAALCRVHARRPALIDAESGEALTFEAVLDGAARVGGHLRALGAGPGDFVFSLLPNSIEQALVILGSLWSGVDLCPILPQSADDEILAFARIAGPTLMLVPAGDDRAGRLLDRCPGLAASEVALDGSFVRGLQGVPRLLAPAERTGNLTLFSSGTTGTPKAIYLNGDRHWAAAAAWRRVHEFLDEDSRFLDALPMAYNAGILNLLLIPLSCGGSTVIAESFGARLVLRFWAVVRKHDVSTLWFNPTMLRMLSGVHRESGAWRAASSRAAAAFLGMAPIAIEEKERFESALGLRLLENFALTETQFLTSETVEDRSPREPGSVGRVLPWVEVREKGPRAAGGAELEVRTPFLFEGYLAEGRQIARVVSADGYFTTGDVGHVRDDGRLFLSGRTRDIVKKGGLLVAFGELENLARSHPLVVDAEGVGVADRFYGENVVLCLRVAPDAAVRVVADEVKDLFRRRLARYKMPRAFVVVEDFPRTVSGKVIRRELLARLKRNEGLLYCDPGLDRESL
jgi:acyl-CoA synthetase (AMP-forming)/AMP-acid ligase II